MTSLLNLTRWSCVYLALALLVLSALAFPTQPVLGNSPNSTSYSGNCDSTCSSLSTGTNPYNGDPYDSELYCNYGDCMNTCSQMGIGVWCYLMNLFGSCNGGWCVLGGCGARTIDGVHYFCGCRIVF